ASPPRRQGPGEPPSPPPARAPRASSFPLPSLGFVPQGIHLAKARLGRRLAAGAETVLHRAEAAPELPVRGLERALRVGAELAGGVHAHEQGIADLLLDGGGAGLPPHRRLPPRAPP